MAELEGNNDKLLIKELITGNEKAFLSLFNAYHKEVYAYSLSILKSKTWAEEIVQDVFLQIWMKRDTLDVSRSLRPFIMTVTKNKTLDFLRKAANDRKLREAFFYSRQKVDNPTFRMMREADLEVIKTEALSLLPPRRKLIFEMSRNDGKSYEEIGQELGIAPNTVKSQMHKALKTLREFVLTNGDFALIILYLASDWY
ncbi:RNA polymerase sigma factor [Ulvibacterium sp.]|uniref:RNA polymerase sigma factor n=1 Tax=Ulvibacterium sp. TaxID=2665914 RepID=UPI003BAB11BB